MSKRIYTTLLLSLAFTAPSGVALAEEPETLEYTFEDHDIHGDILAPEGTEVLVVRRGERSSLISVRYHFVDALSKSVEDL